jgi:hypothetical protein
MYSDIKKDENLVQESGAAAPNKKEKPLKNKKSEVSQIATDQKPGAHQTKLKADEQDIKTKRLPKRKYPTAENRRQYFQTSSRKGGKV